MPKGLWEMMDTEPSLPHSHFDESGAVKSHASNDRNADPPLRHFDRSEAEQQNPTLPWYAA